MSKKEIFEMIKRNKHEKSKAVIYLSDFLMITKEEAEKIYDEEFCK